MTEAEAGEFLEEELALLAALMENSRKQLRKLEKRLWAGMRRLSLERDGLLQQWQERSEQRKQVSMMSEVCLPMLRQEVFFKQGEVEQLHRELMQAVECAKQIEALKLQQLRKGQAVTNRYQEPWPSHGRWNIQG